MLRSETRTAANWAIDVLVTIALALDRLHEPRHTLAAVAGMDMRIERAVQAGAEIQNTAEFFGYWR